MWVGPGAQWRRWGGPPGRRRSCGRSEGSPGRRARTPTAAPAILPASLARGRRALNDAAAAGPDGPADTGAEWSRAARTPRLRPASGPQGSRPQRRVGETLRPARSPSGQCGRGDDRVVGGNRSGPTPARPPAGKERRASGGVRTEGSGWTQLPELSGQRRGLRVPQEKGLRAGRGAGAQHPPRERTRGSKGSTGFPRLPQH